MNKYSEFKIHPVAEIFPLMDDATYQHLKADIAENGQWEMIMMHNEQIIDGRNRLRACCELGIEPTIAELPMELDPYNYAVGVNLHRRHLTTSQRSDVAGRLATLKHGANQHKKEDEQFCSSSDDAAELLNVSRRSVIAAKYVHEHGCKELNTALSSGAIPVSLCEKFSKEFTDKKEQAAIVKQGVKAMREAMKPPTIRKTAKGSEKVSEDKKPRTQPIVPEVMADDEMEIAKVDPVAEWFDNHSLSEIVGRIVEKIEDDKARKAAARQLRKLADQLDPPTKFVKPDLQEVTEYFAELKAADPDSFFDFYESKGWLVGKTSMKDWRASARKWARENQENPFGGDSNGRGKTAHKNGYKPVEERFKPASEIFGKHRRPTE